MNRSTPWIGAALAAALGFAATASAQSVGSPQINTRPGTTGEPGNIDEGPSSMRSVDRDRDGRISPREANRHQKLDDQFTALDRDDDGYLDKAEFARFETASPTSRENERSRGGITGQTDSDVPAHRKDRGERHRDEERARSR